MSSGGGSFAVTQSDQDATWVSLASGSTKQTSVTGVTDGIDVVTSSTTSAIVVKNGYAYTFDDADAAAQAASGADLTVLGSNVTMNNLACNNLTVADGASLTLTGENTSVVGTVTANPDQLVFRIPSSVAASYEGSLKDYIHAYGVTLNDTSVTAGNTNNTATFTASVPTGCSLTVTSSNDKIASVANPAVDGTTQTITVTGQDTGTATITATITLGDTTLVSKTATITVIGTDKAPATLTTAAPETANDVANSETATQNDKDLAASVATALEAKDANATAPSVEGVGVTEATQQLLQNNTISAKSVIDGETVVEKLKNAVAQDDKDGVNEDSVNIVLQQYLDIKVTDAKASTDSNNTKSITLDIKPMVQTIATTADVSKDDKIVTEGDSVNAVPVGSAKELDTTGQNVTVTVPLPSGFTTENTLNVKHVKKDANDKVIATYIYTGTVTDNVLTFENPHGFSEFEIGAEAPVAKIGDVGYVNLQDAVNDAAASGAPIVLQSAAKDAEKSVLSATTYKNVKLELASDFDGTAQDVTINGTTVSVDKTSGGSYTYVPPVSVTTVGNITLNQSANGTLSVNPSTIAAGATVTIVATPNDGYQVDQITVTDKNGNPITVTEKDGQYTFTMPSTEVTVSGIFSQKPSENEPTTTFTDVAADAYYAEAVAWAVENGITDGTSATTFSPNKGCTRAQVVTFLWRAAGEPTPTGKATFADVADGTYYTDAVAWAVENGITDGTSATTFSPNATCTRSQVVTFLARYAKGEASSLDTPFVDVAADAYYTNAVAWAVENEITDGTSATTFSPNNTCTRGQVVTFLYRAIGE